MGAQDGGLRAKALPKIRDIFVEKKIIGRALAIETGAVTVGVPDIAYEFVYGTLRYGWIECKQWRLKGDISPKGILKLMNPGQIASYRLSNLMGVEHFVLVERQDKRVFYVYDKLGITEHNSLKQACLGMLGLT